jgi:CheY-like chemotaxis protein
MTALAPDAGTTVLVVEDEESFVEALTVGLKREGFRVEIARDGAQALDRFHAVHPDLVLLDVMLPTVSGIEVCRQIRFHSWVPIIMVSAKTSELDVVVGLEVGADDYVSKPYRMRELVARMRAVIRRAPQPASSSSGAEVLRSATSGSARSATRCSCATGRQAATEGIRAAEDAAAKCREGAYPGSLDRRGVGARVRRGHQDPRCAHQAFAGQGRDGSRDAGVDRDDPRAGLQVRAAALMHVHADDGACG